MQNPPDIYQVLKKLDSKLPVCRVCLSLSMEYIEFDSTLCLVDDTDITYFDAFQLVTPSQVELYGRLPKTLCSSCGNDLLNAFLFRKRVENADIILSRICDETSNLTESSEIKIEKDYMEDQRLKILQEDALLIEEDFLDVNTCSENSTLNAESAGPELTENNKSFDSSSKNSLFTDSDAEPAKEAVNELNESIGTSIWICNDCGEICTSLKTLDGHRKLHQISNCDNCSCKKCDKAFETVDDLENQTCFHKLCEVISNNSDKVCYRCMLCGRTYKSESDFVDHVNTHKDKKPYNCKSCKDQFQTKHLLRVHTFRYHKHLRPKSVNARKSNVEKKEKCPVCFKMVRKSFMEIHKEVHFGPRNSMCTECGKQFGSRLALRTHSLIHKQSGQFMCHICNKICQTKYALKSHIQFKHIIDKSSIGRKQFKCQCEDCGLIFQYPSTLRVHQRKHNAETPYVCPHCSRSYLRKDQFNIHMRYHNNDLPYKCDQCDKNYATKSNLSEHRKSVHDNVTYSCDKCDQKFKSVTGLRKHKFLHTGYPYVCPICGLGQPFRSGIKAHLLRVHKDTFTEEEFNETFPVVIPKSGFRRPKI